MRCLLTRVLPRRTKTKSQLARPTGVVARGGAIARETRTAVTVNTASGHGATAIAKDAGLTIWRGRPKRCLLTRVLPRRTKTMCQLARPTGVVARGVAIAWETGTAVSVNAATTSGHGASAIAKDARLTIWRERPKRRNQRSPEPRAIRTGRHQLQMRQRQRPRALAGTMMEPHDAHHHHVPMPIAIVCCCSKFYQRKLFSGGIAAGEHSAAATEHREEVLLLRCRRRRARSRNRGSRALLLLQYSSTELGACGCCRA